MAVRDQQQQTTILWADRKCEFLLPVDVRQRDSLQRHLQVDDGGREAARGLLQGGAHRPLHRARARQHLRGNGVQVHKITR